MSVRSQDLLTAVADTATNAGGFRESAAAARLRVTMAKSGRAFLRVRGASMLPALWPGDLIILHPISPTKIVVGDIVVFAREQMLVSHRVEVCRRGVIETRGDASPHADGVIGAASVLGVVAAVIRGHRDFAPPRARSLASCAVSSLARSTPLFSKALQRLCRASAAP